MRRRELGLGVDDLADLALAHERGRTGAGRGIGEQQLHVARAHLAAVDAVGGTDLALDPARHLEHVGVVERRRRAAVGIVDEQNHLGGIAHGPVGGAGEDHLVEILGAHRLVRAFAHHEAQRLDQIGLAATVGADDARHARLDLEIGRLDERLEPNQTKTRELHVCLGAAPARIDFMPICVAQAAAASPLKRLSCGALTRISWS